MIMSKRPTLDLLLDTPLSQTRISQGEPQDRRHVNSRRGSLRSCIRLDGFFRYSFTKSPRGGSAHGEKYVAAHSES